MKLSQKEDTLFIDGGMDTGNIYLIHHSNNRFIQDEGPITCAEPKLTGWYLHQAPQKGRLGRFLHLLPLIWKFCK